MNALLCGGRAAPHTLMFNSVVSMHLAASPLTKCILLFSYSMTKVITYACRVSIVGSAISFSHSQSGPVARTWLCPRCFDLKVVLVHLKKTKEKRTDSDMRALRLWTANMTVWFVLWPRRPDLCRWLTHKADRKCIFCQTDGCWSGELVIFRH